MGRIVTDSSIVIAMTHKKYAYETIRDLFSVYGTNPFMTDLNVNVLPEDKCIDIGFMQCSYKVTDVTERCMMCQYRKPVTLSYDYGLCDMGIDHKDAYRISMEFFWTAEDFELSTALAPFIIDDMIVSEATVRGKDDKKQIDSMMLYFESISEDFGRSIIITDPSDGVLLISAQLEKMYIVFDFFERGRCEADVFKKRKRNERDVYEPGVSYAYYSGDSE
jgi:hypothetical protein